MVKSPKRTWLDKSPLVCIVTDRRRLNNKAESGDLNPLKQLVVESVRAGVDLLQIREPDLSDRLLAAVVSHAVATAEGSGTKIVVNERVDIAVTAAADGVHLKEASMPAERVETILPKSFLIGQSVHGVDEAERATRSGAVDYLVAGTVFSSRSKPGCRLLGLEGLRAIVSAVDIPVIAIGGISVLRAREIGDTGAAGVAGFDEFTLPGKDLRGVVDGFREEFEKVGRRP